MRKHKEMFCMVYRIWDPRDGQLRDTLFALEECVTDLKLFCLTGGGGAESAVSCVLAGSEEGSLNIWQLD